MIHGNQNYKQTGLLQAFAAYSLLMQPPKRVCFASGCQALATARCWACCAGSAGSLRRR